MQGDNVKTKINHFLFVLMLGVMPVQAQNSVVVVPLAGDDAAPGLAGFSSSVNAVTVGISQIKAVSSVTMTLPSSGTAIVNASGNVGAESICAIVLNRAFFNFAVDPSIFLRQPSPFAITRGFDVSPGENTFNLLCGDNIDVNLTVMFFPDS